MALAQQPIVQLVTIASFGLLLALVIVWWRTYRETKSKFSLGLVLFAAFLALQALVRIAAAAERASGHGNVSTLARLDLLGEVGELVALVILVYNVVR